MTVKLLDGNCLAAYCCFAPVYIPSVNFAVYISFFVYISEEHKVEEKHKRQLLKKNNNKENEQTATEAVAASNHTSNFNKNINIHEQKKKYIQNLHTRVLSTSNEQQQY